MSARAKKQRVGIAVAALGTALLIAASPAPAANWLEKGIYLTGPRFESQLPTCDDSWALSSIQRRFSTKEGRFWNSDLQITNFDQIREVAHRPWADGTIPRRFCSGRALISDGKWRVVRYSIVEDGGMIGGVIVSPRLCVSLRLYLRVIVRERPSTSSARSSCSATASRASRAR